MLRPIPTRVDHVPDRQREREPETNNTRITWYLDLTTTPPSAVPDKERDGRSLDDLYYHFEYRDYKGLPDQWLDHLGNLRGGDGKIIFRYAGELSGLDR